MDVCRICFIHSNGIFRASDCAAPSDRPRRATLARRAAAALHCNALLYRCNYAWNVLSQITTRDFQINKLESENRKLAEQTSVLRKEISTLVYEKVSLMQIAGKKEVILDQAT